MEIGRQAHRNVTLTHEKDRHSQKTDTVFSLQHSNGEKTYSVKDNASGEFHDFSTEYEALGYLAHQWKQQGYRISRSTLLRYTHVR